MSANGDMNGWIRQAMTPKHALEAFVGLLAGPTGDQAGSQAAQEGHQKAARTRKNADAGEGNRPENQPDAGMSGHQAMNRLLKEAVQRKDRA